MKKTYLRNDLFTMKHALPYSYLPENTDRAVLMLHGYTGSPKDYRYLAGRLEKEGIAYSVPRLPGAGTDMDDLSETTRRDWLRRAYDAWLDLKSSYSRITITGYSMGGLLALKMAAEIKPESLVLLAPALEVQHKSIKFVPLITPFASFLPQIDTGWREEDEKDEESREHGRKYWVRRDIKSLSQFVMLASETKKILNYTDLPVLLFLSENDPVVSLKTAEVLNTELKRKPEKTVILKNCRHDVPNGNDKETVADVVIDWIKR